MFDVQELFAQVNRIKKENSYVGNNYLTLSALTEFSVQEDSLLIYNNDAIALICEDVGVTRLHFYLSTQNAVPALEELLETVPRRPILVDCVGREEQIDILSQILCKGGFEHYTRMSRLRGKTIHVTSLPRGTEAVQLACPQDVEEIVELLNQVFDPYVSHLPKREKLLYLIENQLIYCVKKDGRVIGAECFERIGKQGLYLYQSVVEQKYRGSGLGSLLWQYSLYHLQDSYFFLTVWVEDNNFGPIQKYQSGGLSFDGLKDAILIYR